MERQLHNFIQIRWSKNAKKGKPKEIEKKLLGEQRARLCNVKKVLKESRAKQSQNQSRTPKSYFQSKTYGIKERKETKRKENKITEPGTLVRKQKGSRKIRSNRVTEYVETKILISTKCYSALQIFVLHSEVEKEKCACKWVTTGHPLGSWQNSSNWSGVLCKRFYFTLFLWTRKTDQFQLWICNVYLSTWEKSLDHELLKSMNFLFKAIKMCGKTRFSHVSS